MSLIACSKFVVSDLVCGNTQLCQHPGTRLYHHRRTTQIILNRLGPWMLAQVFVQDDFMDKPRVTLPTVLWKWRRESKVEGKVLMRLGKILEVVFVKDLLPR